MKSVLTAMFVIVAITACNGGDTHSSVEAPGAAKSTKTKLLEGGADILQTQPPIGAINAYLDGFHFYNGNIKIQMEAHHYCSVLNDEVIQCVIYDGNVKDAKIMGVEYIIDEKLFTQLSASEKALWHSHVHEVKSGQLIAPGIPAFAEHALMEKLIRTYGKTWHTWHTDVDKTLPLGVPQLMMGFTQDGQSDAGMIKARDGRFGIDSRQKQKEREDIVAPAINSGADAWQQGKTVQISDPTGTQHHYEHTAESHPVSGPADRNARSTSQP